MIIAYYALHYGSDYLAYSIRSVYDHVDKIYILYANRPSHGHTSGMVNPDNKDKLRAASLYFGDPKGKINWVDGNWTHEGQQRDSIFPIAKSIGAKLIVVVDSDEIWDEKVLSNGITKAMASPDRTTFAKMLTLWRSFSWACYDEMGPVRMIRPDLQGGVHYLDGRVFHFGYARSLENIRYKISIHGHNSEWRKEWLAKFENWPTSGNSDLHPTCVNTWNASPFDKNLLPGFMKEHPYWGMEVIK
jgi:hypothetical protein